jgi:hypothetical protein
MLKKVQCIEGSVSIESALIIPMIMGVFIFFMSMMQVVYTHGKVQIALNEVCKDLTYDSYVFNELGVIKVNQALYSKGLEQSISVDDLYVLKEQLVEAIPKVASDLRELRFSPLSAEVSIDSMNKIIEDKSDIMDVIVSLHGVITELSQSIGTESGYFINTMLLRVYINEKLGEYLSDVDVDYTLMHASGFLEDQSGQIILSTQHRIPILFMRQKIHLKNGGYFHSFTGAGKFSESYNKVIQTSQYGEEIEDQTSDDEDQDGFAKTVYVTEHGSKYHENQQCFHIKVNASRVRVSNVTGKRPCEYCGDGIDELPDNTFVYTTKNSRVFHIDHQCHSIYHHITHFSEKEAITKGYSPCKSCSRK